jgi:ABC-type transport system involved in cytochrome c biogenesis permease subunit
VNSTSRTLAWCFVALVGLSAAFYLMMGLAARAEGPKDFHLEEFGRIPIADHGRVKPIDTLARVSLMILSGKQEWEDAEEKKQPAIRWLLDVMTAPSRQQPAADRPIPGDSRNVKAYRIEDPTILALLKLNAKGGTVFSFQEIFDAAGSEGLKDFFGKAQAPNAGQALADLAAQLHIHLRFSMYETPHRVFRIDNDQLLALLGLEGREGYRYGLDEFLPRLADLEREARRAAKLNPKERQVYDQKAVDLFKRFELYVGLADGNAETLHLVAPAGKGGEFLVLPQAHAAMQEAIKAGQPREAIIRQFAMTFLFDQALHAYAEDNKESFNKMVGTYQEAVAKVMPEEANTAAMESSFNAFAPFYRGEVLYVMVFVVACVSWLWRDVVINRFAFWLMLATLLVHTWALLARMYIQGRPPVTNLYSSAVFIGWIAVALCLGIELKFRNGLATAVGSLTGFATLLIAHYLGGSGDTLEMMQAVLDTNFWLATHVTSVTIGYSATFVAGVFGIFFLWQMLVTSVLNSLRKGGALSGGQLVLFLVSAVGAAVIAAALATGILYGLAYRSGNSPSARLVVTGIGGLLGIAGISYAIYLLTQRVKRSAGGEFATLPAGASALEPLAMTDQSRKVLTWMIYGTVCFAMLFSFVGTVLGGIWADQSWGRFWGWDPKENGALLIVIMNALILHARWGGMIKERGMAALAIVGNMVTMWSWFGTNQLGIGLHAYGFNDALVQLCRWFWLSQLGLIGLALLPLQNWRSYTPLAADAPAPARSAHKPKGKRGQAGIQPA